MIRILLIVICFILYGSLYPWQYRPGPPNVDPLFLLLHSWPARIGPALFGDVAVNILIYIPVGMFTFLALDRRGHQWLRWSMPTVLALALSGSIEMLQIYDRTRECSLLDLFDNVLGAVLGTGLGFVFRKSLSGGMFLVLTWLAFSIKPWLALLSGKGLQPLMPNSLLELVSEMAAWGLVIYLVPSRSRQSSRLTLFLAVGFTLLLIVRGLSPFHLAAHPTPFNWIPLQAILSTEWIVGLSIFLEKCFFYGGAIWLTHLAGLRLRDAVALIAPILAILETIQRYLPGRTPEITDPLLAVVLGLILGLIEQDTLQVQT